MWIIRKVQPGTKTGQKIGFPTLNFRVGNFGKHHSPGVYECEVRITNQAYTGALYYGPRLKHQGNVLEVHVIDFNKKIYGQFIRFRVLKKLRGVKKFHSLAELKKQITEDLKQL